MKIQELKILNNQVFLRQTNYENPSSIFFWAMYRILHYEWSMQEKIIIILCISALTDQVLHCLPTRPNYRTVHLGFSKLQEKLVKKYPLEKGTL